MSGGLMQLVAYGAQDIFLTGNPIITYFKTVYRRHTNFAVESIEQTFNSAVGFGEKVHSIITRNGDLMMGAYIRASLPDLIEKAHSDAPQFRYTRWIDNIGHYLIKEVSVEIGGNIIDTHYSDWLEIWAQLTVPASKMVGYRKMIGQDPLNHLGQPTGLQKDVFSSTQNPLTGSVHSAPYKNVSNTLKGRDIYIPLQFWFCRNVGLALPLVALQYSEVRINVEFRPAHQLVMLNTGDKITKGLPRITDWSNSSSSFSANVQQSTEFDASLWIDYVYLDTDERRRFAQVSHEYLIEQLQYSGEHHVNTPTSETDTTYMQIDLFFEHPVKELVWIAKPFESTKEYCNFTDTQMPSIPPFANIGYNAETNTNISGLTGLPVGYVDTGDLSASIYISDDTVAQEVALYDGEVFTGAGVLNLSGSLSVLKDGDILLFYDSNNDVSLQVTYKQITPVANQSYYSLHYIKVPAITHVQLGLQITMEFELESIFRPSSILTLDSDYKTATASTVSNFTAITTWDHLNRLTNYSMTRPVNRNGMAKNPISSAQLKLNARERFQTRSGEYFNWVQCKDHHTNIPKSPGINVYSFAHNPEQHQPSGTCNFSRLESAQLVIRVRPLYYGVTGTGTDTDGTIQTVSRTVPISVYAVNYNILRILNGMGGVAYNG